MPALAKPRLKHLVLINQTAALPTAVCCSLANCPPSPGILIRRAASFVLLWAQKANKVAHIEGRGATPGSL